MCMSTLREICGDYSGEDTPVPIPNTEVKLLSADDTWRATSRESKTLPLISFFATFNCLIGAAQAPFYDIITMYFCVKNEDDR